MQELISLADFESAATARLEPGAQAYYSGGAADEITLRDNVASWRRLAIRPRVLVGVAERDLGVTLLGRRRKHPVIVAPMALHTLAHPDGEIATAQAAKATGSIICISTFATKGVEEVARTVPDAERWFQLYAFKDRGVTRELIARAADSGHEALVVTVDLPVRPVREREVRYPIAAELGNVPATMTSAEFIALIAADLTWSDIEHFAAESSLPVLVKGVLRPEDVRLAAEHGARGVIVSNHGGRQLDTAISAADALPAVVEAAGDRLEVLVDGGLRRGTDVLKALALGARAVMVGRPVLWGLAVGGAPGVQRVLEILLSELDVALALAGAPRVDALDSSFLMEAPWR
jgi:4-hydroxymandelate oxidase